MLTYMKQRKIWVEITLRLAASSRLTEPFHNAHRLFRGYRRSVAQLCSTQWRIAKPVCSLALSIVVTTTLAKLYRTLKIALFGRGLENSRKIVFNLSVLAAHLRYPRLFRGILELEQRTAIDNRRGPAFN